MPTLSPPSLSVLAANLQELYAIPEEDSLQEALVPVAGSDRIVSAKSWYGRSLVYYYHHSAKHGEEWRADKLVRSLQATYQMYQLFQESAFAHNKQMNRIFAEQLQGKYIRNPSLNESKSFLFQWFLATKPFCKAMKADPDRLKKFFAIENSQLEDFVADPRLRKLSRNQKIIFFESELEAPVPLYELFKWATKQPCTNKQEKKITSFKKKFNRISPRVGINKINGYLRAVSDCFQGAGADKEEALTKLCMSLLEGTDSVFNQRDPKLCQWRNVEPGITLYCKGREVILGERLGRRKAEETNEVFEIVNEPHLLAVFGINKLSLLLKRKIDEDFGYGIPGPAYFEIEEKGRFALVEKLVDPLGKRCWQSRGIPFTPDIILAPDDFELAAPVVSTVRWFIFEDKMSSNFVFDRLMFTCTGRLNSTTYGVSIPLYLPYLEGQFWKIANGTHAIFYFFMLKSGLTDSPQGKYLQKTVKAVCLGKDPKVAVRSRIMKCKQVALVDLAHTLVKDLYAIYERCEQEMAAQYELPDNFYLLWGAAFYKEYLESAAVSLLLPQFEEIVFNKLQKMAENEWKDNQ